MISTSLMSISTSFKSAFQDFFDLKSQPAIASRDANTNPPNTIPMVCPTLRLALLLLSESGDLLVAVSEVEPDSC